MACHGLIIGRVATARQHMAVGLLEETARGLPAVPTAPAKD